MVSEEYRGGKADASKYTDPGGVFSNKKNV